MTTTSVPIQITCPSWCSSTPQEHADDLWFNGGDVFHHAETVTIEDRAGFRTALAEPRFCPPVEVSFTTTTNPEGRETASPIFYVNDHEHSLEQFEALVESAGRMVALYRSEVPA